MPSPRSAPKSKAPSRKPVFGSETPRIFTPPLVELTPETSLGFAVIEFATMVLEVTLLPWQKFFLIHALELREDGSFRFRKIVLLVARQNGKSFLLQVIALFFQYVLATRLVIGTAQDLDTAEETWGGAIELAEGREILADEVARVVKVNGKKSFELVNGSRYKVRAANRRSARGLSGDLIFLDELREHQSWEAWGAVTKTTNARPNALIIAASNAGDMTSVVLRHLRKAAHEPLGDPDGFIAAEKPEEVDRALGEADFDEDDDAELLLDMDANTEDEEYDDSLGIFEWSAVPDCSVHDRKQWANANPSLGYTIQERTLAGDARTDPEWVYRTEALCQWSDTVLAGPFPSGAFEACLDPESEIAEGSTLAWAVDLSADRSFAYIAVGGLNADGVPHVEVIEARAGSSWVVTWFADRIEKYGAMTVALQAKGAPASGLIDDLERIEGLTVVGLTGGQYGPFTGDFFDAIVEERVAFIPYQMLTLAAGTASTKRWSGDAWMWDRTGSPTDISPLVAANLAYWLTANPPEVAESSYEEHGLLVV